MTTQIVPAVGQIWNVRATGKMTLHALIHEICDRGNYLHVRAIIPNSTPFSIHRSQLIEPVPQWTVPKD